MALKLSVHGRARFKNLAENIDEQRETLLHAVAITRPVNPPRIFVPEQHRELTNRLFSHANIVVEIADNPHELPEQTLSDVQHHQESDHAILFVRTAGSDIASVLHTQLLELESDGMRTVYIRFPAWLPQSQNPEGESRLLRMFFSGLVVESAERWWLQYTRLNGQRFDFSRIQLCDPLALELRDYVENCYRETVLR